MVEFHNANLVWGVRIFGWTGILVAIAAIALYNTNIFLIGQVLAALSAFTWCWYLQNKVTPDLVVSLVLAAAAAAWKEPFLLYTAMLIRAISYQAVFERVVRQRQDKK
jgi:hypothetical protein